MYWIKYVAAMAVLLLAGGILWAWYLTWCMKRDAREAHKVYLRSRRNSAMRRTDG